MDLVSPLGVRINNDRSGEGSRRSVYMDLGVQIEELVYIFAWTIFHLISESIKAIRSHMRPFDKVNVA